MCNISLLTGSRRRAGPIEESDETKDPAPDLGRRSTLSSQARGRSFHSVRGLGRRYVYANSDVVVVPDLRRETALCQAQMYR